MSSQNTKSDEISKDKVKENEKIIFKIKEAK